MRIEKITLTNFRNFDEAEIDFTDPATFFTGSNHVGKSSIVDAIAWAVTGVCRGLDAGGKGTEYLVRAGQPPDSMCVVMQTDKGEIARRTSDTKRGKTAVEIAKTLGVPREVALVCLAWEAFITMEPAAARNLIMNSLGVEVDPLQIRKLLGDDAHHIPPAAVGLNSPEAIGAAFKACYDERSAVTKQLKMGTAPDLSVYAEQIRSFSAQEAQETLTDLRAQLKDLEQELERESTKEATGGGRQEQAAADLEKRLKETKDEIADVERQIIDLGPAPDVESVEKDLKAARKKAADQKKHTGEMQLELGGLDAIIRELKERHRILATSQSKGKTECPTCTSKLTKDQYEKLMRETLDLLLVKQTAMENLGGELVKLKAQTSDTDRMVVKFDAVLSSASNHKKMRETFQERLHGLGERLAEIQADAAALAGGAALEEEPTLHFDATPSDLNALRQRIENGRRLIASLEAYIPLRRYADTYEKDKEALKAKLVALERLVEALSPKGKIVETLIKSKLGPFFGQINEALGAFGYHALVNLTEGFEILIQNGDEKPIPFRLISDSERVRLALAIQIAFAKSSGFGLIVTDDVSRLDAPSKENLVAVIEAAINQKWIEQAILAGTMSGETFVDPELPGWSFIEIGAPDG